MEELSKKVKESIEFWTEYERRRYKGLGANEVIVDDLASTPTERIAKNVIKDSNVINELKKLIEL